MCTGGVLDKRGRLRVKVIGGASIAEQGLSGGYLTLRTCLVAFPVYIPNISLFPARIATRAEASALDLAKRSPV
jgi:hypothetical protein